MGVLDRIKDAARGRKFAKLADPVRSSKERAGDVLRKGAADAKDLAASAGDVFSKGAGEARGWAAHAGDKLREGAVGAKDKVAGARKLKIIDPPAKKVISSLGRSLDKASVEKVKHSLNRKVSKSKDSMARILSDKVTRESVDTLKKVGVDAATQSSAHASSLLRKGGLFVLGLACASAFAYGLGSSIPKVGLEVYREMKREKEATREEK